MFYVSCKLADEVEIPANEIKEEQVDEYVPPPRGKSEIKDFDPLVHLELEPEKDPNEEEDEEEEGEKEDDKAIAEPLYRKIIPNIEKYWLRMEPEETDYIEVIVRTFASGLDQIKSFERWSKHNDLTPYADALEEWDDIVGDSWEEPDSLNLDPKTWI